MRLPLDWLSEVIALPADEELIERLSFCGFEDVMVHRGGPDLSLLRVGRVVRCEQHPNADKLSVCSVDVGDGDERSIVCGASPVLSVMPEGLIIDATAKGISS